MSSATVEPTASPRPPKPEVDPLTASQWRSLIALADAAIPSITPKSVAASAFTLSIPDNDFSTALTTLEEKALRGGREELARQYLAERPSQVPSFKEEVWRYISLFVTDDAKLQFLTVLSALDTRAGALVLTGYPTAFADQPVQTRERIILGWYFSWIPLLRTLAKSATMLCKRTWVQESPTLNNILNFPRTPVHGTAQKTFPFEFIQFPAAAGVETLETDVVIVGSGCGAGVAAKNLSEAGQKVIVVEKAYHWPAEHLPMSQRDGWTHLFMNCGAIYADDSNMAITAGQAFGGGGTINWSASLQPQGYVRREWATKYGLPFFTSAEFQACLDSVCDRMGVSTEHIEHNKTNRVLMEGARKLGWSYKVVPQNTGGKQHYCGYCTLGCGSCEKQGPVVSFLPDAAKHGTRFIEGFDCQEILFEMRKGEKIAVGVKGTWTSRDENGGVSGPGRRKKDVVIKAKRVVVSGGTMQSPLLLKKSGLKNRHIGNNLKTHPVSFVGAVYSEEVRPWEGSILTAAVNEFENLDGRGHGTKLEATTMLPAAVLQFPAWKGGFDFKMMAPKLKNMVMYISLSRDSGSGIVYPDSKDGRCRYRYVPNKMDKAHIMEGVLALAKICYVEGAEEIFTVIPGVETFKRVNPSTHPSPMTLDPTSEYDEGVNDRRFNQWLDTIKRTGFNDAANIFASAHQMGTCRMGTGPKNSVVDWKGKVWDVEGLYVCDASVFPSASGVNPMITNMGISEWISRGLAKDLKRDEGVSMVAKF